MLPELQLFFFLLSSLVRALWTIDSRSCAHCTNAPAFSPFHTLRLTCCLRGGLGPRWWRSVIVDEKRRSRNWEEYGIRVLFACCYQIVCIVLVLNTGVNDYTYCFKMLWVEDTVSLVGQFTRAVQWTLFSRRKSHTMGEPPTSEQNIYGYVWNHPFCFFRRRSFWYSSCWNWSSDISWSM